jgi:hypothetical protein
MPKPKGNAKKKQADRKIKPVEAELPENLHIVPTSEPIPPPILKGLSEFRSMQTFFTSLEKLNPEMETSLESYNRCWLGSETITNIERSDTDTFSATIHTEGSVHPIFVKRIHLLEPVSAMEGNYIWQEEGILPCPSERLRNTLEKINNPYNEAYVDSIFAMCASKLVEGGYSPGFCKCYGTFSARAEKYLYNISEEISSMRHKPWWNRNRRLGIFSLYKDESEQPTTDLFAEGLEDLDASDFIDVTTDEKETPVPIEECAEIENELEQDTPIQLSTPKLRLRRMTRSNSIESSLPEFQQFAEFTNFPVQVTLLEKAEGTMDSLIDIENEEEEILATTKDLRWSAWLFQVIAALMTAQHWYGFVHNDLHTNNVMWSSTEESHLYYRVQKGKTTFYKKIPTFGKIMKIIDFGRSSYTLPEPGGFFISDAFFPGNDASDQYNCEPFFDDKAGKKIEPNPSFDLCRLSVSLLESLFPERPDVGTPLKCMSKEDDKVYHETTSSVYNLLWSWLLDDSGKNVLRNPDGTERYPDFDLYKAIAAEVHHCKPKQQIEKPIFQQFTCKAGDIPTGTKVYDLYL